MNDKEIADECEFILMLFILNWLSIEHRSEYSTRMLFYETPLLKKMLKKEYWV